MIIFGCKIVHVLCFAVTQLNLAYIVKIEIRNSIIVRQKGIHLYFMIKNENQYRRRKIYTTRCYKTHYLFAIDQFEE